MCLSCGCGKASDDHGKASNITSADLTAAMKAGGTKSIKKTAQNILDTLNGNIKPEKSNEKKPKK